MSKAYVFAKQKLPEQALTWHGPRICTVKIEYDPAEVPAEIMQNAADRAARAHKNFHDWRYDNLASQQKAEAELNLLVLRTSHKPGGVSYLMPQE